MRRKITMIIQMVQICIGLQIEQFYFCVDTVDNSFSQRDFDLLSQGIPAFSNFLHFSTATVSLYISASSGSLNSRSQISN